jgi:hypothetical protein
MLKYVCSIFMSILIYEIQFKNLLQLYEIVEKKIIWRFPAVLMLISEDSAVQ